MNIQRVQRVSLVNRVWVEIQRWADIAIVIGGATLLCILAGIAE